MAETATETKAPEAEKEKEKPKPLEERQFTTEHTATIAGKKVEYTARVGRIVLHDDEEVAKPKVAIFYTAYLRKGVTDLGKRPLVFLWNGGPGSSSIWLHMYSVGPRRIVFDGDPLYDTSRWRHAENEHSLLDVADLVFVDPPSTGFSRVGPGEDPKQFQGVEQDAAVVGDFVVEFVNRERRGHSPIVLLGESYGTLRTPAVANYLQTKPGFFVDGVALVSSIMDVAGATFGVGTTLGAIGMLPSYTATAVFHGVLKGDLHSKVAEAENFALDEYSVALLKGSRLDGAERERIAKRFAELTGLSREFLLRSNLRVTIWRFMKELLRDRRRTVGRLDSRWTGIDTDAEGDSFEDDPSNSMITGPATRAFNRYVREDLGWDAEPEVAYRHMISFPDWKPRDTAKMGIWTPQVETASLLRSAVNRAPQLKVLLLSGIYDLATPYFTAELTFDHLMLDPERAGNITRKRYEAGHMMYLHGPSLAQMRKDLVAFLGTLRS